MVDLDIKRQVAEWFSQSDYDFETAKAMFKTRRYIYAVFMCHLSVEKALKALYMERNEKDSPKTHNLNYLLNKSDLTIGDEQSDFIGILNDLCVSVRYPEDLMVLLRDYRKNDVKEIISKTKKVLIWLRQQTKLL